MLNFISKEVGVESEVQGIDNDEVNYRIITLSLIQQRPLNDGGVVKEAT